jgi:NAD-dependent DNA ligase
MNADYRPYFRFTGPGRLEKAINSLIGLIEGISIDGIINDTEVSFINKWLQENAELAHHHPFTELMPVVAEAIADGVLTIEERLNILWLCEKLRSTEFSNAATADMQRLHGLMAGIVSDNAISEDELRGLSAWLAEHEHLRTCWPYDEVDSLITGILRDGRIDDSERIQLHNFFGEFVALADNRTLVSPQLIQGGSFLGLCAVCPEMSFEGRRFVFTGASSKYSRTQFRSAVERLGGRVSESVSNKTDYLVIGADGNPCWAFACYGRKVEMAVTLRKQGARLLLVHENDFHDALSDYP